MHAVMSSRPELDSFSIQLLVDSIPALIHTARPDGHLDYFNKPWLQYLGATLEQVSGWNWKTFIHPEDVEGIVDRWLTCLRSGEVFEYETRVRRADGEYRWMFHRKVPLRDGGGNIVRWYGSSLDIEERKTAEEKLRRNAQELQRSEFYLAEGQRLAHMGSWTFDPSGFDYWSPELFRMHGLDPAEKAPTVEKYLSLVHPDDRSTMTDLVNRLAGEATPFDAIKRIVRPDGEIRYIRCVGVPFIQSQNFKKYVGSAIDITEHELLTQELRQIIELIPQLIAVYGPNRERLYTNRTALDYFGISLDEWQQRTLGGSTHPDDWERLMAYVDRALASGAAEELELRLRKSDKTYRWFLARLTPFRDEQGQIKRWYFSATDIEERKQAEDKLQRENVALRRAEEKIRGQEAELRQMLDLVPQLVAVFGPDHERIYANRTGLDYLGVTLNEWRQTPDMRRFVHPDDGDRMRAAFARAISVGNAYQLEFRVRKNDGNFRWFLARYNPVRDESGQIARWYVAFTDIEDRKQAEDRLQRENVALREEIDKTSMFEEIVGTSPALQIVLSLISKVAGSDSTVLITGETGTGKELVARAIHRRSNRAPRAFVTMNCAAIPRDLIASELFGHEKGAFTGATQQRLGRFELASSGTIFLDEVGELPPETQVALLRVLQEHEFERVGGTRRIRADVRVIAATNRDLQAAIRSGSFRSDLFYRLHVFPIGIPPLRERREDIVLLVEYFIDRYARKIGKNIREISKKTLELLQSYPWPGNIRELQNVIERSVLLCDTESFSIDETWLPQRPSSAEAKVESELLSRLVAQERDMIEAALKESRGQVFGPTGAATKLGIPRSTLESKIRSLKIDKNRFKSPTEN
jgi:PAS domain S-box-containing protein